MNVLQSGLDCQWSVCYHGPDMDDLDMYIKEAGDLIDLQGPGPLETWG